MLEWKETAGTSTFSHHYLFAFTYVQMCSFASDCSFRSRHTLRLRSNSNSLTIVTRSYVNSMLGATISCWHGSTKYTSSAGGHCQMTRALLHEVLDNYTTERHNWENIDLKQFSVHFNINHLPPCTLWYTSIVDQNIELKKKIHFLIFRQHKIHKLVLTLYFFFFSTRMSTQSLAKDLWQQHSRRKYRMLITITFYIPRLSVILTKLPH